MLKRLIRNISTLSGQEEPVNQHEQRMLDVYRRQMTGVGFMPVLFLTCSVVILTLNYTNTKALLLALGLCIHLVLGGIRFIHLKRAINSLRSHQPASQWFLMISLFVGAFSWGVFMAMAMSESPFQNHYTIIYTAGIGLLGGGIVLLSIHIKTQLIYVTGFVFPLIFVFAFNLNSVHSGIIFVIVVFSFGMLWVSSYPRQEYNRFLTNSFLEKQRSEQFFELSKRDWLTKLYNRRAFDICLIEEYKRSVRSQYALSLLMIDIDDFKKINDRYGHSTGDECLKTIARILLSIFGRQADFVGRFGGEEFVVLLPATTEEQSKKLAEELRVAVLESKTVAFENEIQMTISIGGTTVSQVLSQPAQLVEIADEALYDAKKNGKNRVVWSSDHPRS